MGKAHIFHIRNEFISEFFIAKPIIVFQYCVAKSLNALHKWKSVYRSIRITAGFLAGTMLGKPETIDAVSGRNWEAKA